MKVATEADAVSLSPGDPADARGERRAEAGVLLAAFAFFLLSFELSSAVNGPLEIFAQDSVYLLESLARGETYPWNPQSHLLHHVALEQGHRLWALFFGTGLRATYLYLKLVSALSGLAFLAALRLLLVELGVAVAGRVPVLVLAAVSVSTWFHFAAFETHSLAMPFLALFLLAVARLRSGGPRRWQDRLLFVAPLVVCSWIRIDNLRFLAVAALLPCLPVLRARWRELSLDLGLALLLAVAGTIALASLYLDVPLRDAPRAAVERNDRGGLAVALGQWSNLRPSKLWDVGRAVTVYSVLMPIERRAPERSYFAPATYDLTLEWPGRGVRPSTGLFLAPLRNFSSVFGSSVALACVAGALALAWWSCGRRAVAGDPFCGLLAAQAVSGWLFYTWFNPFEPFLWVVEFLPLWLAMLAIALRGSARWRPCVPAAAALGALVHNVFAFYLPFR